MRGVRYLRGALGALVLSGLVAGCGDSSEGGRSDDEVDAGHDGDGADGSSDDAGHVAAPDPIKSPAPGVKEATAVVTKEGGELVTESGALKIPAGALDGDVSVKVSQVSASNVKAKQPEMLKSVSVATAFEPHGQMFKTPITATVFYEADSDEGLIVMRLDNEEDTSWERVPATFEKGAAYFATDHFSIYTAAQCEPAKDPQGICSDLIDGTRDLNSLPEELYVPFKPAENFGDGKPDTGADAGGEVPVDGSSGEPDGSVELPPDAGDPGTRDASTGPHDDDASTGGSTDASIPPDGLPDGGVIYLPDGSVPGHTDGGGGSGGDGDTNPPDGENDGGVIHFPDASTGGGESCGACRPIYACRGDLPDGSVPPPEPGDAGAPSYADAGAGSGGTWDAGPAPEFDGGYYDDELDCPREEWVVVGQECWDAPCPSGDGGAPYACVGEQADDCEFNRAYCHAEGAASGDPVCIECYRWASYCGESPCDFSPEGCDSTAPDGGTDNPCYGEAADFCKQLEPTCMENPDAENCAECYELYLYCQQYEPCSVDPNCHAGDGGVAGPCSGAEIDRCMQMEAYCAEQAPPGDPECMKCQDLLTECEVPPPCPDCGSSDGGAGMDPCQSPLAYECMELQASCEQDPSPPKCQECYELALYCESRGGGGPGPDGGAQMDPCGDVDMCLEVVASGECQEVPDSQICVHCDHVLTTCQK